MTGGEMLLNRGYRSTYPKIAMAPIGLVTVSTETMPPRKEKHVLTR
jgi:hypothetical protein